MSISRERVLSALGSAGDRSLHTMEILAALGVPRAEVRGRLAEVRDVLESLRDLGMVKELPGSRWRVSRRGDSRRRAASSTKPRSGAAAERLNERRLDASEPSGSNASTLETQSSRASDSRFRDGWLTITPKGFGFVADDAGGEIFVASRAMGHALHGDRVRVRVAPTHQGLEGEVVEVLARGRDRVAGTLARAGGRWSILPGDPRLPTFVEVEGPMPRGVRAGMEVVAEITSYPERFGEVPRARVLRDLGPRGTAAVELEKIFVREGIEEDFPNDALEEARALPPSVDAAEIARREDLRDVELLTIDPPDARDHDDAVWAERREDGFRVVVAVADVSHYVASASAIDREALARGCSIYLPDRAIPMLPAELSSNLASLLPGEDRLMLGLELRLSKTGALRRYRFIEGVMRSRARLTYADVAAALGLTSASTPSSEAVSRRELLATLLDVSKLLRARRRRRGALELELPEAKVLLDEAGEPRDVVPQKGDPGVKRAYGIIEDLMLLANETVAEHLARAGLPAIFRVHGKPDPKKIEAFSAVARAFGVSLENETSPRPKDLQNVLARFDGTPFEGALSYLLLRAMQQASYQVDDIGHFALAARHYLHFTSPIRRYPDLAVHRIVRKIARGEAIEPSALRRALVPQAVASSRMERRAMQVEREVQALYRALLMSKYVGDEIAGVVGSVAEQGLLVTLDAPFVEVKVPLERLGDDVFELDRLGIAFVARRSRRRFALGSRVLVRIDEASIERREVVGSIVEAREAEEADEHVASKRRAARKRKGFESGAVRRDGSRVSRMRG